MKPLPLTSSPESACCPPTVHDFSQYPWIIGAIESAAGPVPVVSADLTNRDRIGAYKVRWGIERNNYSVPPGLYAVGNPDSDSPVLVTANYKLTLDTLRCELSDIDVWILVLDTKGINVWCAAGKGTFGTAELIKRIVAVRLKAVVNHRTLILPQLGAPGVSAHEVARISGFKVIYGPVRARDVKTFLSNGMKATPEMRRVHFTTRDRFVLTPVELVPALKSAIFAFGILFILNSVGATRFNGVDMLAVLGAVFTGAVVAPILLPWIPGPMFSLKGALLGLLWAAALIASTTPGMLCAIAYLLLLPSITAFLAMNFTGASTYTSFSGVKKEMMLSVPPMLIAGALGALTLLADAMLRLAA